MAANLQVLLDHRPTGKVSPANFRFVEAPVPAPGPGQVLVRHSFLSLDPYMRGRLNDAKSYAAPQEVGAVMGGGTVGVVEASNNPRFKPGDAVVGMGGWQRYFAQRRRGTERGRRQGHPHPGLPWPGRHARRHGLVRPQQDHRAEGRRDRAGLGRNRRGRFRGRPARQARGRAGRRDRRRSGEMRLCRPGARLRRLRRSQVAAISPRS